MKEFTNIKIRQCDGESRMTHSLKVDHYSRIGQILATFVECEVPDKFSVISDFLRDLSTSSVDDNALLEIIVRTRNIIEARLSRIEGED